MSSVLGAGSTGVSATRGVSFLPLSSTRSDTSLSGTSESCHAPTPAPRSGLPPSRPRPTPRPAPTNASRRRARTAAQPRRTTATRTPRITMRLGASTPSGMVAARAASRGHHRRQRARRRDREPRRRERGQEPDEVRHQHHLAARLHRRDGADQGGGRVHGAGQHAGHRVGAWGTATAPARAGRPRRRAGRTPPARRGSTTTRPRAHGAWPGPGRRAARRVPGPPPGSCGLRSCRRGSTGSSPTRR